MELQREHANQMHNKAGPTWDAWVDSMAKIIQKSKAEKSALLEDNNDGTERE